MTIQEVEKKLNVTRANVRFYEKEGLLHPTRKENNYRDYSDADVQQLQKILLLRKLGFTIEEISALQNGELMLDTALNTGISRLEDAIDNLKGSLEVARKLQADRAAFEDLDRDHYWEMVCRAEENGSRFVDIASDYLAFESKIFDGILKRIFFHDFGTAKRKHGLLIAWCILLLLCILRGLFKHLLWNQSFWDGFLYPFSLFAVVSLILLPIYITEKKCPKVAKALSTLLLAVSGIFLATILLALLALLLNQVFHFWF